MATVTNADPLQQQQFVLLGKWYRNQDRACREQMRLQQWTAGCHNGDGGDGGHQHNPQCLYYPYKPAHIGRQTIEHKRVYAVPDAGVLFPADGGDGPTSSFRLRTPRPKVRTVRHPDGSTATTVTTYKCKFVPLGRLHENNRLYGPVLSSLPVVLSRSVSFFV